MRKKPKYENKTMKKQFKKKRPPLPKFHKELRIAVDPQTGRYDPTALFAFWKRSPLWNLWQKEGITKDDPSLIRAFNYPVYILRDFRRWWLSQTDSDFYIRVPWTDFDDWLKKNGFTGKVDKHYIGKKNARPEQPVHDDDNRVQPEQRNCTLCNTFGQHSNVGGSICAMHAGGLNGYPK